MPFSTEDSVDHPVSLYAATKKANELMAPHLFSPVRHPDHRAALLYSVWSVGRPDMALFKFTKAMLEGKSIDVYNYGKMKRDFTYIDDIVEAVVRVQDVIRRPMPTGPLRAVPRPPAPRRIGYITLATAHRWN
ncbi:Uridine diphosphate galacturonate 4-epimerase [Klebsiella pneumoniae subsp. ozaenae]|uniref:Uridine diphosphate galacturonate 4-epimerase n=1 Tax=Klebsiella pneumoniae subsp. ozaenae TaxID=574 RepID=A0A377ZZY1_KLEPO|nr:Uridine diphosphate galacturonate 4-epimerase [Klebsiella pneumoniae subsp. ozaenae]